MPIHVQTWTGTGSVRITDMTNAGKRGKTCRQARFSGWLTGCSGDEMAQRAHTATLVVMNWAQALDPATSFDAALDGMRQQLAPYLPLPEHACRIYDDEVIRGIDAPKPVLTAGVDGQWSASLDDNGVHVCDLADHYNEPTMITHDQTHAQAYRLAAKVWERVKAARTFSEAGNVLRDAGCKLHYYCAVD